MFTTLVCVLLAFSANADASTSYPAGALLPRVQAHASKKIPAFFQRRSAPGATSFLLASPAIPGKPVTGAKRRAVRIPATLKPRQDTVCGDDSYDVCPSQDMCCPKTAACCDSGDCCSQGYHCCSAGDCCPDSHDCVQVGGVSGCCPKGKTCSASGTQCADEGFALCVGENFCCKPGDTCYRDEEGKASCGTPPGDDGGDFNGISIYVTTVQPTSTAVQGPNPTSSSRGRNREDDDDQRTSSTPKPSINVVTTTLPNGGIPTTMSGGNAFSPARAQSASVAVPDRTGQTATVEDLPTGSGSGPSIPSWNGGLVAFAASALVAQTLLSGW